MTKRNVYGMDFAVERGTKGASSFGTFAEVVEWEISENDTFKYIPFDYNIDGGDDETCRPLFIHKKTGFKMYWYKYPLRYAYCNKENVTSDFLKEIVEDCVKSLPKEKQIEYYNMIVYGKFKAYLNSPVYKIDDEPFKTEEYIRDKDGDISTIIERNISGAILKRINVDKEGNEMEVFDYLERIYKYTEYETITTGVIGKRYMTVLKEDGNYNDSVFLLDKRVILENKNGMKIAVETDYFHNGKELDTETKVMIDYIGSNDYTSIVNGIRETYIHDKDGELKRLIRVDKQGHMESYDMDIVKHVDGTTYYFQDDNFIANKKDELGRVVMNVNAVETIKSIYDDRGNVRTREYYTTLLKNEDEKRYAEELLNRLSLNSNYGVMGTGSLQEK